MKWGCVTSLEDRDEDRRDGPEASAVIWARVPRTWTGGVVPSAIPAPQSGGDAAHIPREVYHVMHHLTSLVEMEGSGPCEGGVQEIEFGNRVTGVVIS